MKTGSTIIRQPVSAADVTVSGLLIALVFVATEFVNIRLPISVNGGLIHLGNVMLFVSAILFGRKKGALAGAFGMGLFDIVSGWMAWTPFTFIIRGIMGYIIGTIANNKNKNGSSFLYNLMAILAGGIWMIMGYYLTEVILYGNWLSPMTSITGNIIQIAIGAVVGLPLVSALRKLKIFNK